MIIDNGYVSSSPDLSFSSDSTRFYIPAIQYEDVNGFNGEIQHAGTKGVIPASADVLEIELESEYYEDWYDQFADADADAEVTKDDDNDTVYVRFDFSGDGIQNALTLGMSDSSSFDLNELPETDIYSYNDDQATKRHNATVNSRTGDGGNSGGGITIAGDFFYDGERPNTNTNNFNVSGDVEPTEVTMTPEIKGLLVETDDPNYTSDDGDLRGGMSYADELTLTENIGVARANILVVDGDLTIDDAELEIFGSLDVHVHGDLILRDGATVKTEKSYNAKQISFFVENDIIVRGAEAGYQNDPEITGLIYGGNGELNLHGGVSIYGSMTVNGITVDHHNKDELDLQYDERLEGESLYATSRVNIDPSDRFSDYDVFYEDDPNFKQSGYDGNVFVNGEATAENINFADLAVLDDLDISGGVVEGDLWIGGDADIRDEVNVHDDLFVGGDATIESGTYDNIYVMGDLKIDGDPNVHGEIHVLGDFTLSDSQPIDDNIYVGGDADIYSTVKNDLHVLGSLTCDDNHVNGDLYVTELIDSHGCGNIAEGENPTAPHIPSHLLPVYELMEMPNVLGEVHYFDVRISQIQLE